MAAPTPGTSGNLAELWACVQGGRWFHALPTALAQQLQRLGQARHLAAGDYLFRRGDPPCGLYAVARGSLCISGTTAGPDQTHTALLTLIEPPIWFGEIALFDGAPRSHDACATVASTVLHIPQAPLLAWLEAYPAYWQPLALLLTDKLRASLSTLEEQSWRPAAQRLASRLVQMAEGYGQWQDRLRSRRELEVSQEQLARMLGLSRQTTNQILQHLQQAGLVQLRRGRLEVCDLAGLRKACS